MTNLPFFQPASLRSLLLFPLRGQRELGQVLLVSVLVTGLQIAFFPLAVVLDAGYSMGIARSILTGGGEPVLPRSLEWKKIFVDR